MNELARTKGPFSNNSLFRSGDPHRSESDFRREIAKTLEAVNSFLLALQVPARLHPFIQAVIAASDGRIEFHASDARIACEVRDKKNVEANKKWAQRARKSLTEWQVKNKVTLIQVAPGYKRREEYISTSYKVPLVELAAEVLANPGRDMRQTARILLRKLGSLPAKVERAKNRPRMDPEALLNRYRKTILTLTCKMSEAVCFAGGNPVHYISKLTNEQAAVALALLNKMGTDPSRSTQPEALELLKCSTVTDSVHSDTVNTERTQAGGVTCRAERFQLGATDPPPTWRRCVDLSCSLEALELFQSIGTTTFEVTMRDEDSGRSALHETFDVESFREKLPELLSRNVHRAESLIVRPRGSPVIQIDDLTEELIESFDSVAFLTIETSPRSYQVWLAPTVGTSEERVALRERLLRKLEGTSADRGANGSVRWPGSLNRKREHRAADGSFPQVTIVSRNPGLRVTQDELERLGLVAPLTQDTRTPLNAGRRLGNNIGRRRWPDYQKMLNSAPLKKDGLQDRSVADWNWSAVALRRGFSEAEVIAELRCVSGKAKSRESSYAENTVKKAAAAVLGLVHLTNRMNTEPNARLSQHP